MKTSKLILGTMYALCFSVLVGVLGTCDLQSKVKYEVTGSAFSVDLEYKGSGGYIKQSGVLVPWSSPSFRVDPGEFLSISAQNTGPGGSVTVTIYVNDVPFLTSTESGGGAIAKAYGSLSTGSTGVVGQPWGNSASAICAELHRQGLMEETIFEADEAFGRYLRDNHRDVLLGYQLWAKPVVKWMQKSETVTRIVASVATPWSYEMAYRMGARDKGSVVGEILMFVGVPVCRTIGSAMIWAGNIGPRDDADGHEDPEGARL